MPKPVLFDEGIDGVFGPCGELAVRNVRAAVLQFRPCEPRICMRATFLLLSRITELSWAALEPDAQFCAVYWAVDEAIRAQAEEDDLRLESERQQANALDDMAGEA